MKFSTDIESLARKTMAQDMARKYNMGVTICLVISLYIRYDLWIKWSKSVNKLTRWDTLQTTGLWKNLVVEILINVIAPYHLLDGIKYVEYVKAYDYTIEYEVNDLMLFFMFVRLYLPLRYSFYLSDFMNPRTQRVCAINGCTFDSLFALKGLMK